MGFNKEFWKIDKHLLPLKVHYFLFFAALSCVLPFRTVFAKQLGISATAVGVIFLAVPFMKTVTNPLFGVIVDYFKKIRLTLLLTMIFVAVTHVAMLHIPPLHRTSQFSESDLQIQLKYHCPEETLFNNNNVSYLEVKSQLVSTIHNDSADVSCEITCNSQSSSSMNVENSPACVNNISLQSKLILKIRRCHHEHSFPDESVFIFQNSTKKSVKVGKKVFNFVDFLTGKNEENCSLTNHSDSDTKMESTTNGNLSSTNSKTNFQLKDSLSHSNFRKIFGHSHLSNIHDLFLIEDEDYNVFCSCPKWLSCNVKHCNKSAIQEVDIVPPDEFLSSSFWMLFILTATSSVSFAAVCFLIDAVCYEMLDSKEKYGTTRLWGTIGWGIGALVGGYLNQLISTEDSTTDYSLSFYLLALLIVIGLIPVSRIKVENLKYSPHICKDVCFLFSNFHLVINIFMVFAIGVVSGLMWNYQFWFMEEIGSSQMLLGLSQIFECWFSELPCFIISGWVIRKIGYTNCNSLTFFCFGIRYLFFAYMQNPWMTLPVALIYGPTFGIFFASMTMYGKTEAPPGTEATVQSILAVAFEGVGCGTGSILGGIGFDTFGSRKTFLYTGIACFVLLAVNVLLHIFVLRQKKKPSEKEELNAVGAISYL